MLAFFGTLGWPELVVISLLGVLIFGKRLPEVGKSIGKGIVEFKKGLAGIETDLDELPSSPESPQIDTPPRRGKRSIPLRLKKHPNNPTESESGV